MGTFRITCEDGNVTTTRMNATLEQARAYFIGQKFQFGDTDEHPGDLMLAATAIEEVKPEEEIDIDAIVDGARDVGWMIGEDVECPHQNDDGTCCGSCADLELSTEEDEA